MGEIISMTPGFYRLEHDVPNLRERIDRRRRDWTANPVFLAGTRFTVFAPCPSGQYINKRGERGYASIVLGEAPPALLAGLRLLPETLASVLALNGETVSPADILVELLEAGAVSLEQIKRAVEAAATRDAAVEQALAHKHGW